MTTPRIVAFAGSARDGSHNRKLIRVAAQLARDAGAEVTLLELRDYPLPIYNADIETREGLPANVGALKELLYAHDGLLIASPENNASVSALLKNTLDWVSRPAGGPADMTKLQGKVAAMLSATTGVMGGLRGLVALRAILQTLGVLTLPDQYGLSRAQEAFDGDGLLKDAAAQAAVSQVVRRLVHVTARLA
jgi:chromate reductase